MTPVRSQEMQTVSFDSFGLEGSFHWTVIKAWERSEGGGLEDDKIQFHSWGGDIWLGKH